VPGYRVGGKTGTAHKVEGGVYAKKYVASFVGIAPISDPRLVVAVMIDEPSGSSHYGGDVAGPAFSQITGGALRTLGIPPDAPLQVAVVAAGKGRL
jgi:cell division protein FtsI (penicillin-binding protein 3)